MLINDVDFPGPRTPRADVPPRVPNSARRTSVIDTSWPGEVGGDRTVVGRASDTITDRNGDERVAGTATLHFTASHGHARKITTIDIDPPADLTPLIGRTAGPGFRKALDLALPGESDTLSLRYLLLDDVPGASLVAGHATAFTRKDQHVHEPGNSGDGINRNDMCAGWDVNGSMMVHLRTKRTHPHILGAEAPVSVVPESPTLPRHGMRRARRLDVVAPKADATAAGSFTFDIHFRDSHMGPDGVERSVHEYSVLGTIAADGTLLDVHAIAHCLPFVECPNAALSATRLIGLNVRGLRTHVRNEFTGTSTCTHLNDTLRGMADLERLLTALTRQEHRP
ncbi:MAG: DUF2889 domain-containing protein [Acidimicrobiia bacterium]